MDALKVYWHEEFLAAQFRHEPLIGDDILDRGEKMLVVGPSEAGKSYLVNQMALNLATGTSFMGFPIPRPVRVEILQSEVSVSRYQERYRKLAANFAGIPDIGIVTIEDLKLDTVPGVRRLTEHLEETAPEVLILDPLRAFFQGDENDSGAVERFFQGIAQCQNDPPFTLVMVHHVRKEMPGVSDPFSKGSARGSGLITDRPSTVMGLSVNPSQTEWQLAFHKTRNRNRRPDSISLVADFDTGLFVKSEANDFQKRVVQQLCEYLAEGPRTQADVCAHISESLSISKRTVQDWIMYAVKYNLIVRERVTGVGNPWRLSLATASLGTNLNEEELE